jgi:hypothetical protein
MRVSMRAESLCTRKYTRSFMCVVWVREAIVGLCLVAVLFLSACTTTSRRAERQQRHDRYVSTLQSLPKKVTRAQLNKALPPLRPPEAELPLMTPADPRRPLLTEWYPLDADFELKVQVLHHQGMNDSPKDEVLLNKASIEKRRPEPKPTPPPPKQKAAITFNSPPFDTRELSKADRETLALLKIGTTRRQVDQHFAQNGGLYFPPVETHYLPEPRLRDNAIIAVDIAFKPARMDEATFADPDRRNAWMHKHYWIGRPDDVVKGFGKPYESHIAID